MKKWWGIRHVRWWYLNWCAQSYLKWCRQAGLGHFLQPSDEQHLQDIWDGKV